LTDYSFATKVPTELLAFEHEAVVTTQEGQ